jgi:predicted HTH domain antitoxin
MVDLSIQMPEEAFSSLKQPPREFASQLRLAAAIHWYARGEISMEKGAIIAGLDRADFLKALASREVDVFNVDMESLRKELESV